MCRHKGYTPEKVIHVERWDLEQDERDDDDNSSYATAYMQPALTAGLPVIMRDDEGNNISVDAFWGILSPKQRDFTQAVKAASKYVNIRSETVHQIALYNALLKKKQRCLIPCSYYFEHHHFKKYSKKGRLLKAEIVQPG